MRRLVERFLRLWQKGQQPEAEQQMDDMYSHPGEPQPKNAPGDFYVLKGCCLNCGVPVTYAPDLFSSEDSSGCWVSHQPRTSAEMDRMVRVFSIQELGCIRYAGDDAATIKKLSEIGEGKQCDVNHR